jgi:hypothetical protein
LGSGSVWGTDVDELEVDGGTRVVAVVGVETVVKVELERNETVDVRRNERQACARRLTAVRCGALGASSSSSSGLTVDLNRMRSHQLGTRCLLLESYTPLSPSSPTVPSPAKDRLERASDLSEGVLGRKLSGALSADGAARSPRSGVVGTLFKLWLSWGV